MVDAIIFDMDGTMIDSEPLWHVAEKKAFGLVNIHLSTADCLQTTGLRVDAVIEHWFSKYPWDEDKMTRAALVESLMKEMVNIFHERGMALAKPGLFESIKYFQQKGYRLAIATSSQMMLVEAALEVLNLKDVFEVTCSAQHVPHGKPHPDVYLLCADMLKVHPTKCLAIEDSINGVISAKAARMKCIAIPEILPASPKFAIADVTLLSLLEINDQVVANATV